MRADVGPPARRRLHRGAVHVAAHHTPCRRTRCGPIRVTVEAVAFYLLAAAAVAGGCGALLLRNPAHVAAALGLVGASVGVLMLAMGAELPAGAELAAGGALAPAAVLVAAGDRRRAAAAGLLRRPPLGALCGLAAIAGLVAAVAASSGDWRSAAAPAGILDGGTARTVGSALLGTYTLPLLGTAVLLMIAVAGAVALARRDAAEEAADRAARERREREERVRRRREDRERGRARSGGETS